MAGTVTNAERAAATLLEGWWTDEARFESLPVDPFRIARQLGILIRKIPMAPALSGQINVTADGGAIITINATDHPNRQRFTAAHEIGHYTRIIEASGQPTDAHYVDYRSTLAGAGVDRDEIYANQFAAALLMPARAVQHFMNIGLPVDHMAALFGTSIEAMRLRLKNLRLLAR